MSCPGVPIVLLRSETSAVPAAERREIPTFTGTERRRTTVEGLEVLPTILSIVVVLAALGATLLLLRWATTSRSGRARRNGRQGQLIEVVERQSVGRNSSLVVIRYNGAEHVLGVTESQITQLTEGTIDLRDHDDEDPDVRSRVSPSRTLDALRNKTVRR